MNPEFVPPCVSVCVSAYNHEEFIRPCLESLLSQETDFRFEILVGDDASTDATPLVVEELARKHPGRLRLIRQSQNSGGIQNYLDLHGAARGDFVAHVDGDDYALPGKLQAQVDVLRRRPELSLAAHLMRVHGSDKIMRGLDSPVEGGLEDLVKHGNYLVNSSIMYRRAFWEAPATPLMVFDYTVILKLASHGPVFLDKRVFGVYRIHSNSYFRAFERLAWLEQAKHLALEIARERGASAHAVLRQQLASRCYFALRHFLAQDLPGFQERIHLARGEWPHASGAHRLMSLTRRWPGLLATVFRLRSLLYAKDPRKLT